MFLEEVNTLVGSARLSPEQSHLTQAPRRSGARGALAALRWEPRDRHLQAPRCSHAAQGEPPLAAGVSAQPFFRLHFLGSLAAIERGTVAGDKSCIHCTNRALKRQYTDSFFALCEN